MKLIGLIAVCLAAMTANAAVRTSVCSIAHSPRRFDGQIVRISGFVRNGEGLFFDDKCGRVEVEFPSAEIKPRVRFHLVRNSAYDTFMSVLRGNRSNAVASSLDLMDAPCARADMEGRIDARRTTGDEGMYLGSTTHADARIIVHKIYSAKSANCE
jgi:hypothetical protein